jgi:hypothetical protein
MGNNKKFIDFLVTPTLALSPVVATLRVSVTTCWSGCVGDSLGSTQTPPDRILKEKLHFIAHIGDELKKFYPGDDPGLELVEKYLTYVKSLGFDEEPDYERCREILKNGLLTKPRSLYLKESFEVTPKKAKKRPIEPASLRDVEDVEDPEPVSRNNSLNEALLPVDQELEDYVNFEEYEDDAVEPGNDSSVELSVVTTPPAAKRSIPAAQMSETS